MSDYERPIIWDLEKKEITRIAYLSWIEGQKFGLKHGRLISGKQHPEFNKLISEFIKKKASKTESKIPWWKFWSRFKNT